MLNRNDYRYLAAFTFLTIALLVPVSLSAAESASCAEESASSAEESTSVYRSVDAEGRVVFSDKGSSGAKKIKVRDPITFPPGAFTKPSSSLPRGVEPETDDVKHEYDTLVITQPLDDATIRSNSGNLTVEADLSPSLFPNHRLQLVMDQQVHATNRGAAFQLINLDRGVHELRLQIVDANSDAVIKANDPVHISILRPSILHQNRKGG